MKPYHQIAIADCGEPLVSIPADQIALVLPHPYVSLGAPYGDKSPFFVRQGVCDRLLLAQAYLQEQHPDWRIQIFDAYRPIAVQHYMVDYAFQQLVREQGLDADRLTQVERQTVLAQVYEFWAMPSDNPATPPPHSTGAAVDVTLVDRGDRPLDMGSPIDEISPRSYPNHFANSPDPQAQTYHQHRQLLRDVMLQAGFQQHPQEWWHFCFGDQMWAWLMHQANPNVTATACYGAIATRPIRCN